MPAAKISSAPSAGKCMSKVSGTKSQREAPAKRVTVPSKRQRVESAPGALVCAEDAVPPQQARVDAEPVISMLREILQCAQDQDLPLAGVAADAFAISGATLEAWDHARSVESCAKEAHSQAERAARSLEEKLSSNGSGIEGRRRSFATNADAVRKGAKAVAAAKVAQEKAETDTRDLARKKDALVMAEQDYLRPLLAGVGGVQRAEALVASFTGVLAGVDLEIGDQQPELAEIFAKRPAKGALSKKEVLQQLEDGVSKLAADLGEKLARASQDQESGAGALAQAQDAFDAALAKQRGGAARLWGSRAEQTAARAALEKAWAEVHVLAEKVRVSQQASAAAAQQWFVALQGGPLAACLAERSQAPLPLQDTKAER